ncbi:hypothetical protein NDU88_010791 [Pleurodeles waltl]|uniref:Uncharacterized protein n=1 Tax=Pleurodeles waltl TaxID=8319 RepID=A0AAV7R1A8_PLEWA|nr:hypothetical protein NDU88_010791 [Pleurodeles waltl]
MKAPTIAGDLDGSNGAQVFWPLEEVGSGGALGPRGAATGARSQKKRRRSGDQPHRDRVLRSMKMQASQGKRAAIRAAASLTDLPTSDKDKTSHMDAGETEDSLDHESVADPLGGLPHVTPQATEDII